jgi:N-acetylglucosaminyldiphosphoundecaprenol N-acetyl-beta-D-mannosaminyltransferase
MIRAAPPSGIDLLDIRIQDLSVEELVEAVIEAAKGDTPHLIAYANVHAFNLAARDARFKRILQNADRVFCDGVGVRLGAWIMGRRLRYRNTPPDWMPQLAMACAQHQMSLFLLGGHPGVAEQAAARLCREVPGLRIAGSHHGYFDKGLSSAENRAVVQAINEAQTNILLVGFGMPAQEYWIDENRAQLNVQVFIPVGALFDYLAERLYRAPRWMTDNGLEWLARLVVEPRRLWRRYLIGNPQFLWRVIRKRLSGGGPRCTL